MNFIHWSILIVILMMVIAIVEHRFYKCIDRLGDAYVFSTVYNQERASGNDINLSQSVARITLVEWRRIKKKTERGETISL